ncbi:conjugal transfer protein TrbH [Mesorhizobium sp. B2-5-13]|uniref:conjugal transfer protein TrbH n=1 Tax=unclassified Mesorhizobium TaxID=325217 RepID=UPI00112EE2EC|nr:MULTISPECIES: conjugal transfer protein TrbH [unclassified Mesorhizobium]TPJ81947.1 conjugal transfer protein TrbH [Mesorhizobium sp. B2-5-13]TPK45884.1 conjugal transfer protein TrbH [Mesorhizobium sp. B2-5-5]
MSMLSLAGRILGGLLLAASLAACQTLGGAGLVPSTVTTELTPEAASSIAGDMVGRLAEQVGPGNTTIAITPDSSVFGQALEASLKGWGYAIVTDQQTKGTATLPLAYVVDAFEGSVLVRLSTTSVDITRMYKLGAGGAEPVSPVSVMQRGPGGTS